MAEPWVSIRELSRGGRAGDGLRGREIIDPAGWNLTGLAGRVVLFELGFEFAAGSAGMCRWLVMGLVAVALMGCGGAPAGPVVVPVTGVITLDGAPLADAKVLFLPNEKTSNPCTGTTDAAGKYTLTQSTFQGATPGSYKVTVEVYQQKDGKPVPEEMKNDMMQLIAMGRAKQILPPKYADASKTTLTAEVTEPKAEVNFELVTK